MTYNKLTGGTYVEPYAGGAGAALHLLFSGAARRIMINDIDPAIHALWSAILKDASGLIKLLRSRPVTIHERERQLAIYSSPTQRSPTELGFATLFLNRTSRSGILSGGVIGGKGQKGKWRIDARFNKVTLEKRIKQIALYAPRIALSRTDALSFLNAVAPELKKKTLLYLDPPYYHKGSILYRNAYTPRDHQQINHALQKIRLPWILTYDACREIEGLYSWANGGHYSIYYSASDRSRRHAEELLYYSGLKLHMSPYMYR